MPAEVDHVIVVDDASDDGTFEVARRAAENSSRVIAIAHDRNRGVGAAIATGYARALALPGGPRDAFVVMAGDGQMDPRDLPTLVLPITRGEADYVKGDRFASHGALRAMPRARYVGGHVLSALTRVAIDLDVNDSQCGYTAIARDACAELDLEALWPRFGYPNDLLAMVASKRFVIAEVPVHAAYPHAKNKLGARHVPLIAFVIARAWIRRMRG